MKMMTHSNISINVCPTRNTTNMQYKYMVKYQMEFEFLHNIFSISVYVKSVYALTGSYHLYIEQFM